MFALKLWAMQCELCRYPGRCGNVTSFVVAARVRGLEYTGCLRRNVTSFVVAARAIGLEYTGCLRRNVTTLERYLRAIASI